ncbi:ABC transporter permease subunit [Aneurinibacillus sp. Ricciae_BoGa-3]|uniref:ABC transporter permease n=1 Tax=Aneurinibacillus sp. Ricciae_BoGa-3 TaxID=3022697 RepID=UPI002340F890|nr:ABC transporter permease subunit [Aneurinibacillus sp. Ricciae_BoGa-3]WCK52948.1 ABC transporter permease subunit [Aneurinibacillus sp. Ricciae_BoGa-3]
MLSGRWIHTVHLVMTAFLIFLILIPFVPLILSSFSAGWRWPEVLPHTFSMRAWEYVFLKSSGTWDAIQTSVIIALLVTLINLVLAVPAADALARMDFKGKRIVEGMLYAPMIIPSFVAVMGLYMTFIRLDLTESMPGVVVAHISSTLPYMIRALIVSFGTLGFQWEEQGRMLGAGRFQRFRYIVFPHILPGVVAGASLSILVSLSQYLITFLVGGGQVITLPLILFPFISGGDPAVGSAYTVLFAGVSLVLLWGMDIGLKRYYRKQITIHF